MKKIMLLLLFGSVGTLSSHAQFTLHAGGGVNLSLSHFNMDFPTEKQTLPGVFLEFGATKVLHTRWSTTFDLQYVLSGYRGRFNVSGNNPSTDFIFSSIQGMPQVTFFPFTHWGLTGGGFVNLKFDEFSKNEGSDWMKQPSDFEFHKTWNAGWVGGVVYEQNRLKISARYLGSLVNYSDVIITDINGDPFENQEIRHNILEIGLAYKLMESH